MPGLLVVWLVLPNHCTRHLWVASTMYAVC
jgi:hypothetical protein